MPRTRTAFAAALMFMVLSVPATAAGDDVVIVSRSDIAKYWTLSIGGKTKELSAILISGRLVEGTAGCIEVGFMIDPNGSVTGSRVLRAAVDLKAMQSRSEGLVQEIAANAMSGFHFKPAPENAGHRSVFTTYPIVYLDAKWGKGLDPERFKRVTAFMQTTCAIDDLPHWIDEHGVKKTVYEQAPGAAEISASADPK